MKNLLLAGLVALSLSSAAHAALIGCTVSATGAVTPTATSLGANTGASIANGIQSTVTAISCPGLNAGAFNTLSNVQLFGVADYQGGPANTTSGTQVNVTLATTGGPFGVVSQLFQVSGGLSSNTFVPAQTVQIGSTLNPGTQTLAAFSMTVASSVPAGGPVANSFAQAYLSYSINTTVPEPGVLSMIGVGLVGLGALARKLRR